LWIEFYNETEAKIAPGGELECIGAFVSKIAEHVCRIATILQLFENPDSSQIDEQHMSAAISLGYYYIQEVKRLTGRTSKHRSPDIHEEALTFINEKWGDDKISPSDLARYGPRGDIRKVKTARAVLVELCRRGHMEKMDGPQIVHGKNPNPETRLEVYRLVKPAL